MTLPDLLSSDIAFGKNPAPSFVVTPPGSKVPEVGSQSGHEIEAIVEKLISHPEFVSMVIIKLFENYFTIW